MKMFTGIIVPTEGELTINGYRPWERKKEFKILPFSKELFLSSPADYRNSLLPQGIRVITAESGITSGWEDLATDSNSMFGINTFGTSGPGNKVAEELGPQAPVQDILQGAKKRLVSEFPGRFGGTKPPAQSGDIQQTSNETSKSGSGYTVNDLTDEQRRVGNAFVDADQSGKFTMQTYVDQLAAIGGIGE